MSSSIFYRTENIRRHSNLEQHSARCRTMKMKNMPAISHPNRKLPQETCCMTSAAASLQYKIKTLQQAAGRRQNHPKPFHMFPDVVGMLTLFRLRKSSRTSKLPKIISSSFNFSTVILFARIRDKTCFQKTEDILREKSKCSMDSTSVWQKAAHLSD